MVFTPGWADTRVAWEGVVSELPNTRCITWDLRGHGESDIPAPGNYTREHALADLERVCALAGGPVILAGHSLGGYLSLAHTLNHPDAVQALILVAAGPGFRKEESRMAWNESVDVSAKKLGVPEGSEEISKHVDAWVIDNLGSIEVPVLAIVGEHDKRFQASVSVFEKYMDVRSSVVVPDAGHSVHRKHGAPVAAAIKDFLKGLQAR